MHAGSLPSRQGSALILVLWCLLLLGMAVFGIVEMVELSVEHASRSQILLEARTLASSGLALGLNPQLLKDDPLFAQSPAPGRKIKVTIQSEGDRLNLNYVLRTEHREILVNLFTQWGLQEDQADRAADCLYDWITPGDLRSLNGAKANDYQQAGLPQRPSGKPFISFDEIKLVMGMDLVEKAKANWEDSFTLWSGGPLNVNEAPADLIAAVFGIDSTRVATFVNERNGRDGVAGTSDDVPVKDTAVLQGQLALDNLKMTTLSPQISLNDPTRRIESVGQVEGMQLMISVVTQLNTSPPAYFLWSEQ